MQRIIHFVLALGLATSVATSAIAEQPVDAWITTKAKVALLTAADVNGLDLDVDTFDAVVTIHGSVPSVAAKQQAARLVGEVDGVRQVRDLVQVVPTAQVKKVQRADAEIKQQVETVLSRDQGLEGSSIRVESVNLGTVVLGGEAESLTAHRRALEDARSVEGVTRVASQIESPNRLADEEIWWGDAASTGDATGAASDLWILTKAKIQLMTSPGLSPLAINVDTRDGRVTLFGTVATDEIRERAGREIAALDGVRGVDNELQVVPAVSAKRVERNDADLRSAVSERLEGQPELSDAAIEVEVENAVVRLTGTVRSQTDRLRALTTARTTEGVDSVIDDLLLERKDPVAGS